MTETWRKYEAKGRWERYRCLPTSQSWPGLSPLGEPRFAQPPGKTEIRKQKTIKKQKIKSEMGKQKTGSLWVKWGDKRQYCEWRDLYKCPQNDKNCIMIISSWDSKDIFGGTSSWKGNLPIPIVPFPFSKPFNQLESSLPSVHFCLMRNCAPLLTHSHS